MKKGQIVEGIIQRVDFPNRGICETELGEVIVKNTIPGQKVRASINKVRGGKKEGRLLEILEKAPGELCRENGADICPHFGACGGCTYQNLPYEAQLELKSGQIKKLLDSVIKEDYMFDPICSSPCQFGFRNKMEFSFGDEYKDGPLALGLHKRGSTYDIVSVTDCRIVDEDMRAVLTATQTFYREMGIPFYHKMRHTGTLRHLLVRRSVKEKKLLVALVTTSQMPEGVTDLSKYLHLEEYATMLQGLSLEGSIAGIMHFQNDSLADTVRSDKTTLLYGVDRIEEELLGLRFEITPFSFFQTNTLGAEVLYDVARNYIGMENAKGQLIYDLYSGTGTIAQMLAPVAKKVIGVEIVEEAVEAAKKNALGNGLQNCEFIAGDVLKVLDEVQERPDFIVLDPPRDGIHPKALEKIIAYGVERMIYISCKPTSLIRDLEVLQERGYRVVRARAVDMFAGAAHVETVVLLSRYNQM